MTVAAKRTVLTGRASLSPPCANTSDGLRWAATWRANFPRRSTAGYARTITTSCGFGALAPGENDAWPSVGGAVGECVARGEAQYGVLCCWTGTGVSIAANKVAGVRAALCGDAATAGGRARVERCQRALPEPARLRASLLAEEMLDAWFAATPTQDPTTVR